MAQNSSRLHRLLTLLETGSTQATRFAAARQIGDIAKSHPQELNALLRKVSEHLRSKNWDTRVAAAHAIGAIAENVKHTTLKELFASVEAEARSAGLSNLASDVQLELSRVDPSTSTSLSFGSFNVSRVLEYGSPLLASGGQEYDVTNDNSKSPAERLARQKQNLRRRLGLDVCEQFMDVSEVIRDEDLLSHKGFWGGNEQVNGGLISFQSGQSIQHLVASMVPNFSKSRARRFSARELNVLKRKAKTNAKDHARSIPDRDDIKQPNLSNGASSAVGAVHELPDAVPDEDNIEYGENGSWPFQQFVEHLIHDMFDPVWEVRHGTIMALREIIAHQGASAAVYSPDLDSVSLAELDVTGNISPNMETPGINLNEKILDDESNHDHKRLKKADESNPSPVFSFDIQQNCARADDEACPTSTSPALVSSALDITVKAESDLSSSGNSDHCKDDMPNRSCIKENTGLNSDPDTSQNSMLAKMIKLAKYSWVKNWEFLQDCAIRFLCVLSLDRFGDYVSDQVVAPVRETCAQALGAVFKYMHPSLVHETLSVLLKMQHRQEWEVRHGSLLGIKYLVAVRQQDMLSNLLLHVLHACKAGLEDPDDDVRAVAAEALVPAASYIVSLGEHMLHSIVMLLWDILLDLDDLSPSTSSVMNLLAEIYSQAEIVPKMLETLTLAPVEELDLNKISEQDDSMKSSEHPFLLATLTPRLWPFMRHTITSVRYSAIRTLERLIEVGYSSTSDEATTSRFQLTSILGDALRIVFQNLLLESNDEILRSSERVWRLLLQSPAQELESAARLYFGSWMQLVSTPYGSILDSTNMFWPSLPRRNYSKASAKVRSTRLEYDNAKTAQYGSMRESAPLEKSFDVSASVNKMVVGADSEKSVTHTRVLTATALGLFASKLPQSSWQVVLDPLWNDFISVSGVQRQIASMVLAAWLRDLRKRDPSTAETLIKSMPHFKQWLVDLLQCSDPAFPTKNSTLPYSELSRTYSKMRTESKHLFDLINSSAVLSDKKFDMDSNTISVDEAINFATSVTVPAELDVSSVVDKNFQSSLESAKQGLLSTSGYIKCVQNNLHVTVSSLLASARVWMLDLPDKLNAVILPLMASIKREQEEILQDKAAEALAELIFGCISRERGPNDKLVKNLCALTCSDSNETPQAAVINSMEVVQEQNLLSVGKPPVSHRSKNAALFAGEDRLRMEGFIARRGSEMALKHLCERFGPSLFNKLPKLWDCLTECLKPAIDDQKTSDGKSLFDVKDPQLLINNIQVVRSITPLLAEPLRPQVLSLLPCILGCVRHPHIAVRLAAARCITSMAKSLTADVMTVVIGTAVPMLAEPLSVSARQGAGMLVSLLVQGLGMELIPYAPLLVVPLLKCMNDSDRAVRQSVTHSFAALVPLLPLAKGAALPDELGQRLSSNAEDVEFLEQLLDNSHIDDYRLSIDLRVELRRYQQEGVNWLAFLRRFKLHGILCDDMGLGKTLQASAIIATDVVEWRANNKGRDPLSLIICPSTLVGHWAYEIDKYIDISILSTLQYVGSFQERSSLRSHFDACNVVISSYDIIRKDIDFLGEITWNYCVLDEGHIIKSSRSKITTAVKQLKAEHRLILSGTPIQNNVLELWSLFDFLMPGFLGSEKQFQATYGKPLLAAKDAKCSAKDAEAGILAMEALHKQVMPFLLRRTKDEVLSDLPEKIIQDRYCDLSPLQLKLYDQFSCSDAKEEISTLVKEDGVAESNTAPKATRHVFQALQYLLKLCSHPLLVVGNSSPDYLGSIMSNIGAGSGDVYKELHDIHHSPKLVALQEILQECGIGMDVSSPEGTINFGQHRVLIFAQHKAFLDIIERDLFQSHMKSVTYLRLDGSVDSGKRFEIVKAFNSDPTIDVLLLTTHVGGLGLNLTSADTLVFMEHDWNPMKDLQAMDRAHRLGQRKVVNVHRLIMRGTLEEKVMSLQKFKMSVANAVINAENASMKTMNTDQLLDLFTSTPSSRKAAVIAATSSATGTDPNKDAKPKSSGKGLKSMLNGLEELWDQSQYTDEYDLNQFLARLNG